MLSFAVYSNGRPAETVNLAGAYVVGSDDVPLRAELTFKDGIIGCTKRAAGPAGIAILWDIEGVGSILTESVRLQERKAPYILTIELARGRLMRLSQKIEDWGLADFDGVEPILKSITESRERLILALQADTPAQASEIGDQALALAASASEALTAFHADLFLSRRKQAAGFSTNTLGCSVHGSEATALARDRLAGAFDFVTVPIVWRDVEPNEQSFKWKQLDAWVETLAKARIPIKGSALLSLQDGNVPDWLYIWEHDFDTIRDLAFEHVRRVINRYGQYIQIWDVISGIHATNCFTFSFEHLMELTRMAASLTKQASPRGTTVVEMVAPWGEYYGRNQRTIPPLLYADMVVQSGINFDAFGIQFHLGPARDGMFVRDMFQISSLLDLYAKLGKPLHVTAVQVPSKTQTSRDKSTASGGLWHKPWDEQTQSDWLQQFSAIALSKPFVESVSWHTLADHTGMKVPFGGLLRSDLAAKPAYNGLVKLRSKLGLTNSKK